MNKRTKKVSEVKVVKENKSSTQLIQEQVGLERQAFLDGYAELCKKTNHRFAASIWLTENGIRPQLDALYTG